MTFFFVTAMFRLNEPKAIVPWIGIVFVSVLAHELGHAFMGRAFGLSPAIELYGFGGLTSWVGGRNIGHGRSLLISLAGPSVSLILAVAGWVTFFMVSDHWIVKEAAWANTVWTAFNLLPVMPLDGGNAFRSGLGWLGLKSAEVVARVVAIPVALLAAVTVFVLAPGWAMAALFLGSFAISNVQALLRNSAQKGDQQLLEELQAAYPGWLERRDGKAMIDAALQVRARAKTEYLRAYAAEVIAMGQCLEGDPRSALATLESMPQGMIPGLPVYLHVLFEAGETARANALAAQVMQSGDEDLKRQVRPLLEARGIA
jgi:Zn-dependent protease